MKRIAVDTAKLERSYGIVFMGRDSRAPMFYDSPERLAFDAQPGLVTTANAGILSLFTTYVEP